MSSLWLTQLSPQGFRDNGTTEFWLGLAAQPEWQRTSIHKSLALASELTASRLDCRVCPNIRHLQFERMIRYSIRPDAMISQTNYLHSLIVLQAVNTLLGPVEAKNLLERPGVQELISGMIDELLALAKVGGCEMPATVKSKMIRHVALHNCEFAAQAKNSADLANSEIALEQAINLARASRISTPNLGSLHTIIIQKKSMHQTPILSEEYGSVVSSPGPSRKQGRLSAYGKTTGVTLTGEGRNCDPSATKTQTALQEKARPGVRGISQLRTISTLMNFKYVPR